MQSELTLTPVTPITYDGRRGALTALFYRNLALSIVTLGVYRFWAITNTRAFLWQHWKLVGEPFDYSGTGKELFIGFLKVAVALLMLSTAAQIGQVAGIGDVAQSVIALGYTVFVFLLYVVGSYLGLRYRMARTRWRGVAFVQAGTLKGYLGLMLLGWFLCVVTLGLYLPWFQIKRARYVFNHLSFGSIPFRQNATAKGLFKYYLAIGVVFPIAAAAAGAAAFFVWFLSSFSPMSAVPPRRESGDLAAGVAIGAILLLVGFIYAASLYRWKLVQTIVAGLSCGPLRFAFGATLSQWIRLSLGNFALTWFTLGLLHPFSIHRTQIFWARHLKILGAVDPAQIEQAAQRPLGSEGLTGFLGDMDAGFTG